MDAKWNPWHGCHKISPGCAHCYVYRMDSQFEKDSSKVVKTASFELPIQKKRDGSYKIPPGTHVATCFTSDFFVEEADEWRREAWEMIAQRKDLHFMFFTKRIGRMASHLPPDWGKGYPNVTIGCTVENQQMAEERLPIFLSLPIQTRLIICAPLLGPVQLTPYLSEGIAEVTAGGESGPKARVCDYSWILSLREQCRQAGVPFQFHQTGARLIKDGKLYRIKRKYQHSQAKKANIGYFPEQDQFIGQ
jgi:protein gp37